MHVFCICPCSAQLSMFHMGRRSRNMLIVIITINCIHVLFNRQRSCRHHVTYEALSFLIVSVTGGGDNCSDSCNGLLSAHSGVALMRKNCVFYAKKELATQI